MNPLRDVQILGRVLVGLALVQLLPALAAALWHEPVLPYLASAAAAATFGGALAWGVRPEDDRIRTRDGFVIAAGAWGLASVFGTLPYLISGTLAPVDALYEATAGFTTTASTVLGSVESAPRALLLWRAMTQWLGAAGVIVFAVVVLPFLGIGGMQLFATDRSRSTAGAGRPRFGDSSRRLLGVYAVLTGVGFAALLATGVGGFDALCHALTSVSTGGFSTRTASVGGLGVPAAEWVLIALMGLGATNFVLLYRLASGRQRGLLGDPELRYYAGTLAVATGLLVWTIRASGSTQGEGALRPALFQAVSMMSGTGFHTRDYLAWGGLAQLVLMALVVVGGMSGSTTGGLKSLRLLLGLRALRDSLTRLLHPHAIRQVKYGGRTVPDEVIAAVWGFFTAYFLVVGLGAAVVASAGADLVTAVSLAFSLTSNVGPALGDAGPGTSVAALPAFAKLVLCGCMTVGRLDVFTLLILLQPRFWRG